MSSAIDLYFMVAHSWDGLNPMPPEMWLLPYSNNPLHPGRYWCHCRMVYLPMSYVYGTKAVGPGGVIVDALKEELYCTAYDQVTQVFGLRV
jgi:squalene cyclase